MLFNVDMEQIVMANGQSVAGRTHAEVVGALLSAVATGVIEVRIARAGHETPPTIIDIVIDKVVQHANSSKHA